MEREQLGKVRPTTLQFAGANKRFFNRWSNGRIGVAHWAKHTGLIAGWLWPSAPKVKEKSILSAIK